MDFQEYIRQLSEEPPADHMTKALRRKAQLGELGMITGDAPLTKVGASMVESAGSEAWRNAQMDQQRQAGLGRALESEEDRKFQAEQNRLTRALQAQIAAMKTGGLDEKDLRKGLQGLSRDYVKSGIPNLNAALNAVEAEVAKYENGSIPGMGATGALPAGLLSQSGRNVRQKVAQLRNILLKTRSGSAVTDQEFQRFAEELGGYLGASDKQLLEALPMIRTTMEEGMRAIYAGYEPEVEDVFKARMGQGHEQSVGLQVGDSEDGYVYKGGDPADPKSWAKRE